MAKRHITAHKGGRSKVWPSTRLTKNESDLLRLVLENRGMSFSDWVVEKAKEEILYTNDRGDTINANGCIVNPDGSEPS